MSRYLIPENDPLHRAPPLGSPVAIPPPTPQTLIPGNAPSQGPSQFDSALRLSAGTSPAIAQRVLKMQGATGLPPALIESNLEEIEKDAALKGFDSEKYRRENPKVVDWLLKNPAHIPAMREDFTNLGLLEQLMYVGRDLAGGLYPAAEDVWSIIQANVENQGISVEGYKRQMLKSAGATDEDLDAYSASQPQRNDPLLGMIDEERRTQEMARAQLLGNAPMFRPDSNVVAGSLTALTSLFGPEVGTAAYRQLVGTRPAMSKGWGLIHGGVQSFANWASIAASTMAFGEGAGLAAFFVQGMGSGISQAREEGLSPEAQLAFGERAGAIQAGTEMLPFHYAAPVLRATGMRLLGQPIIEGLERTMARGGLKGLALTGLEQATTEVGEEEVGRILDDWNAWHSLPSNKDKTYEEFKAERWPAFLETLATTLVTAGLTTGTLGTLEHFQKAAQGRQTKNTLNAIGKSVTSLKAFEHSPEKVREFLESSGPHPPVSLPVEETITYLQSQNIDPGAFFSIVMPGGRAKLEKAIETGEDIVVPMADYATKLAHGEHGKALNDIARFTDEDGTPGASEADSRESLAVVKGLLEAAVQGSANLKSAGEEIVKDITGQLVFRGMSPETIEADAKMMAAGVVGLAMRSGRDPMELWRSRDLRINRPIPKILAEHLATGQFDALLDQLRGAQPPTETEGKAPLQVTAAKETLDKQPAFAQLQTYLQDLGIDVKKATNEQIRAAIIQADMRVAEKGVSLSLAHKEALIDPYTGDIISPELTAMRDRVNQLTAEIDALLEAGSEEGLDDKEAERDTLMQNINNALEQDEYDRHDDRVSEGVSIEEQFARVWADAQLGTVGGLAPEDVPDHLRSVLDEAQQGGQTPSGLKDATDEQLMEAAKDAFNKREAQRKKLHALENATDEEKMIAGLQNLDQQTFFQREGGDVVYANRAKAALAKMDLPPLSTVPMLDGSEEVPALTTVEQIAAYWTKQNGKIGRDFESPENVEKIVDALLHEALYALTDRGNAVGWYDRKLKAAMRIMTAVHPELKTDPNARFAFILMLAVTSNGLRSKQQFVLTEQLYREVWKKGKKFPVDLPQAGPRATQMAEKFQLVNTLMREMGIEELREFMTSRHKAREIAIRVGANGSYGEPAKSVHPGALFLGAKIGSFFTNLYGEYDTLTMDRWFMRTINRLRGRMLLLPGNFVKNLKKMRGQIARGADTFGVDREKIFAEIDAYIEKVGDKQDDVLFARRRLPNALKYARLRHKDFAKGRVPKGAKPDKKGNYKKKSYLYRTPVNKLAKIMHLSMSGSKDSPMGALDRTWIRGTIIAEVQKRLAQNGIVMENADLQAVLWYHEKDLFKAFRDKAKEEGIDEDAEEVLGTDDDDEEDDDDSSTAAVAEDYEEAARFAVARLRDQGIVAGPSGRVRRRGGGQAGGAGANTAGRNVKGTTYNQHVWHGAPRIFDEFSNAYNRTGEGANSFGHGLYFASLKSIAAFYRDKLTKGRQTARVTLRGKTSLQMLTDPNFDKNAPERRALDVLNYYAKQHPDETSPDRLLKTTIEDMQYRFSGPRGELAKDQAELLDALDNIDASDLEVAKPVKGRLYKVDIPEDEDFLDWDAPIREQSEKVQEALHVPPQSFSSWLADISLDPSGAMTDSAEELAEALGTSLDDARDLGLIPDLPENATEEEIRQNLTEFLKAAYETQPDKVEAYLERSNIGSTGEDVYRHLTAVKGSQKAASEYLNSLGIAGIKYADASSRGSGGGTSNYVVFNDKLIKILEYEQSQGTDEARGSINFGPRSTPTGPRKVNINLFRGANLSTFLHESGHFFLELFMDLTDDLLAMDPATLNPLQQQMLADREKIFKNLGITSRDQIGVKEHEQFADTMLAYFRTGKAPSKELEPYFRRFADWLGRLYKSLRTLGVHLDPEIHQVMARFFATDDAIAKAEAQSNIRPVWATQEESGLDDFQWAAYEKQRRDAHDVAWTDLYRQQREEEQRTHEKWWTKQRAKVREEVAAEVQQEPVYRALSVLKDGKNPDGTDLPEGQLPMRLDAASIERQYGEAVQKNKRNANNPGSLTTNKLLDMGVYRREGGVTQDHAAETLGFPTGHALITAIIDAPNKEAYIEAETEMRMRERHGDMMLDGSLGERAEEAVNGPKQSEVIVAELKILAKDVAAGGPERKAERARKAAGKALLRTAPKLEDVRRLAEIRIHATPLGEIKPNAWLAAASRAAAQAIAFAARGEHAKALAAKTQHLLNTELYRAGMAARAYVDKQRKAMSKFFRADEVLAQTRNMDYVAAAQAIASAFMFPNQQQRVVAKLDLIKKYDPDLHKLLMSMIGPVIQVTNDEGEPTGEERSLEKLTYGDFIAVSDTAASIWMQAAAQENVMILDKMVAKKEAIDALTAQLAVWTPAAVEKATVSSASPRDDATSGLLQVSAWLTRVSSWVYTMDMQNINGPFHRFLLHPILAAVDAYNAARLPIIQRYLKILEPIQGTVTSDRIDAEELAPGFFFRLGRQELLHAMLHRGNFSNFRKLLVGRGWGTYDEETETLDTTKWDKFIFRAERDGIITKADWDFAQGVWDLLNETKADAQKAHHAMYGMYFNEVTADEFRTKWGTYKGGYVPAIADPKLGKLKERQQSDLNALTEGDSTFMFPTGGKGFTIGRVENYNMPLKLDLAVIGQHIDKVMRFSHLEGAVKGVAKLIWRGDFSAAMDKYDKSAIADMLIPWLQRTANQRVNIPTGIQWLDNFSTWAQRQASMKTMMLNVVNGMQNVTGIALAMTKGIATGQNIKAREMARAMRRTLWEYLKSPKGTVSGAIANKSMYMKVRLQDEVRRSQNAIKEILLNPTLWSRTNEWLRTHAYAFMQMTQNVVDIVVWNAAYSVATARKMDEPTAVRFADSIIRDTQQSSRPEDVARYEATYAPVKALVMFSSYFNMQANMLGSEFKVIMKQGGFRQGAPKLLYVTMMGFTIPAIVATAIQQWFVGFDDDDDESWLDEIMNIFVYSQAKTLFAMFPGVGQIGSALTDYATSNTPDVRFSFPVFAIGQSLGRAAFKADDVYRSITDKWELTGSEVKDILALMTALTGPVAKGGGVPFSALGRSLGYATDVASGKAKPKGPLDYARGVLSGRAPREDKTP